MLTKIGLFDTMLHFIWAITAADLAAALGYSFNFEMRIAILIVLSGAGLTAMAMLKRIIALKGIKTQTPLDPLLVRYQTNEIALIVLGIFVSFALWTLPLWMITFFRDYKPPTNPLITLGCAVLGTGFFLQGELNRVNRIKKYELKLQSLKSQKK